MCGKKSNKAQHYPCVWFMHNTCLLGTFDRSFEEACLWRRRRRQHTWCRHDLRQEALDAAPAGAAPAAPCGAAEPRAVGEVLQDGGPAPQAAPVRARAAAAAAAAA